MKTIILTISILFLSALAYSSDRMEIIPLWEDQLGQHGSYYEYKDDGTFDQGNYLIQRPPYYDYQRRQDKQEQDDREFWWYWDRMERQNEDYRERLERVFEE